ncbi:serine hydrolase domain-containing protein [Nocardia sp. SYP-A9097]|uniref:serine hydrolase domain-containing protein n=1 Tax=Nocardia sp. SYP-A9097 TaxID=2663237 RepID=UPI001E2A05DA|nr:serine hydrolase domain-containing protein [Nocardia sp. SYP-A9097]
MPTIYGEVDPAFDAVTAEFERNFAERGEVGASVCVILDGRPVVDLWGGVADPATGRAWERDTVGVVFSCTKAAVALCIHLLSRSGEIDPNMPVSRVWPEFAANGKGDITIGMLLDHSAGIPVLSAPIGPKALQDWDFMTGRIAEQTPFWRPGTRHGYHPVTFGHTLGEVVRRVTGVSIGSFFATEIAEPMGLDFWIGLPEQIEPRIAPIITAAPGPTTPFLEAALHQRGSIPNLFVFNSGDFARTGVNTRAGRAAEIPGANGVTNARGLARLYAGALQDPDLIPGERFPTSPGFDETLHMSTRFDRGFMRAMDNHAALGDGHSMRVGAHAYGHCGSGGSIGFADPAPRLSVGYTMNKLGHGTLLNERGQALVDAVYRSLGLSAPPIRHQLEQDHQ